VNKNYIFRTEFFICVCLVAEDCLNMTETGQININSAEDLMNIFLSKTKKILLQFYGSIFSNLESIVFMLV